MFGTYVLPQISICSSKDGRPSAAPRQLHFVPRWRAAPQSCTLLRRYTAADGCWGQVKRTDQQRLNSRRWCWGSENNGPATLEQLTLPITTTPLLSLTLAPTMFYIRLVYFTLVQYIATCTVYIISIVRFRPRGQFIPGAKWTRWPPFACHSNTRRG